jgi:hypothetical protein
MQKYVAKATLPAYVAKTHGGARSSHDVIRLGVTGRT